MDLLGICYIICMCVWRGGAHVSVVARRSQRHLRRKWLLGRFRCEHSEQFFWLFIDFMAIYSCLWLFLEFV